MSYYENFIKKSKEIHKDRYDYSKVVYVNSYTKVVITCPEHGDFYQRPQDHIKGSGCTSCSIIERSLKTRSNTEIFVKKSKEIHKDKYDYKNVNYINSRTSVSITCKRHGDFYVLPKAHLTMKSGCPLCGIENQNKLKTHSLEKFIELSRVIHGDKYDYSKTNYINNKTKVIITCPEHGDFYQSPNGHKNKNGCPWCKESKGEKRISTILDSWNIEFIREHRFQDCVNKIPLKFDFFIVNYNICIEFDGRQHNDKKSKYYSEQISLNDIIKDEYCKKNNIKIIRIPYIDYNRIEAILRKEIGDVF